MMYDNSKYPLIMHGVSGLIGRSEANYLNQVADRIGEGIYADLGTFKGRSALCLADGIRRNGLKNSKVVTVDAFDLRGLSRRFRVEDGARARVDKDTSQSISTEAMIELRAENVRRVCEEKGLGNLVEVVAMPTAEAPSHLYLEGVEFLFIDAGHTYDNCLADWHAWRDLVREEVAFHDSHLEGIARVLDEEMEGWELADHVQSITTWRR